MRRIWPNRSDLEALLPALAVAESFLRPSMPPLDIGPAAGGEESELRALCRATPEDGCAATEAAGPD